MNRPQTPRRQLPPARIANGLPGPPSLAEAAAQATAATAAARAAVEVARLRLAEAEAEAARAEAIAATAVTAAAAASSAAASSSSSEPTLESAATAALTAAPPLPAPRRGQPTGGADVASGEAAWLVAEEDERRSSMAEASVWTATTVEGALLVQLPAVAAVAAPATAAVLSDSTAAEPPPPSALLPPLAAALPSSADAEGEGGAEELPLLDRLSRATSGLTDRLFLRTSVSEHDDERTDAAIETVASGPTSDEQVEA